MSRAPPCAYVRSPRPDPCPRSGRLSSWRSQERSEISLFLDIGQGAGLAGASGVRPFLPPLLVGGAARQDIGVDFDASDTFGFVEDTWFLLAILALAVAAYALERVRGRRERPVEPDPPGRPGGRNPIEPGLAVLALLFGAVLFAASLDESGHVAWPGLIAGAACALLGYLAVAALFSRARRRLEDATLLEVFADGVSLLVAVLTIALPALGYAVLAAFLVLLVRAGGERGKKYEGLRILR